MSNQVKKLKKRINARLDKIAKHEKKVSKLEKQLKKAK